MSFPNVPDEEIIKSLQYSARNIVACIKYSLERGSTKPGALKSLKRDLRNLKAINRVIAYHSTDPKRDVVEYE